MDYLYPQTINVLNYLSRHGAPAVLMSQARLDHVIANQRQTTFNEVKAMADALDSSLWSQPSDERQQLVDVAEWCKTLVDDELTSDDMRAAANELWSKVPSEDVPTGHPRPDFAQLYTALSDLDEGITIEPAHRGLEIRLGDRDGVTARFAGDGVKFERHNVPINARNIGWDDLRPSEQAVFSALGLGPSD